MKTRNMVRLSAIVVAAAAFCGSALAGHLSCAGTYSLSNVSAQGVDGTAQFTEFDPLGVVEKCFITLSDYRFPNGIHGNVLFAEADGSASDLLTLSNNTLGQAVICFSSDGATSQCNRDTAAGGFPDVNFDQTKGTYQITINAVSSSDGKAYQLTVYAGSDGENVLAGGSSDTFSIVGTPEPSGMLLVSSALLGLGVLRRRFPLHHPRER